VRDFHFN